MKNDDARVKDLAVVEDSEQEQGFDLDKWLAGVTLPARTVTLNRDSGLRAEYDQLEQKFLALQVTASREQEARLSTGAPADADEESGPLAEQYEVALAMQDVIARMQDNPLTVRVRAVNGAELDKIRKKFPESENEEERVMACIHVGGTIGGSAVSRKQWRDLRNAVGERQFADVVRATYDVNGFGVESSVLPDFPAAAAALLASKD